MSFVFKNRIIWFCVVIIALGLFPGQVGNRIVVYRQHKTNVDVKIHHLEKLKFPSVTICNENNYRLARKFILESRSQVFNPKCPVFMFFKYWFFDNIGFFLTAESLLQSTWVSIPSLTVCFLHLASKVHRTFSCSLQTWSLSSTWIWTLRIRLLFCMFLFFRYQRWDGFSKHNGIRTVHSSSEDWLHWQVGQDQKTVLKILVSPLFQSFEISDWKLCWTQPLIATKSVLRSCVLCGCCHCFLKLVRKEAAHEHWT